jgi:uncharacterized protein YhaN
MKIREIGTKAFGRLRDFKSGQLDSDIIVICGRNEAGKSTLFNLICTLLYGFSPASRDKNPYFPWQGGGPMGCEGRLQTKTDEMQVFRTMGGSISGNIVIGDKSSSINNRPLEETEGISRDIFSELYALTQDKLSIPDSVIWQKLQDQLLGGQFTSFLNPTGKVISDIQSQADSLYRDSNRGKSMEKELTLKIKELTGGLREAEDNEKLIRENERRLHECQIQLSEAMERKKQLMIMIDKAERLLPVMRKLDSINQLEPQAAKGESYMQLPADILQEITQLQNSIDGLKAEDLEVQEEKEKQQCRIEAYTDTHRALCSLRDRIEVLSKAYSQTEDDISTIRDLEYKLASKRNELQGKLKEFAKGGAGDGALVEGIDEVILREGMDRVRSSLSKLKDEENKLEAIKIREGVKKRPPYMAWISVCLIVLGIIGLLTGGSSPLGFAGGFIGVIGAGFLMYYVFIKSNSKGQLEMEECNKKHQTLQKEYEESVKHLSSALNGVQAAETRILSGDDTLLLDVHTIKECLSGIKSIESQKTSTEKRLALKKAEASQLIGECGLNETGDIPGNIGLLEESLKEALRCQDSCIDARDALKAQDIRLKRIDEKIVQSKEQLSRLMEVIEQAEGESLEEKNQWIMGRRELARKLRTLREQLEADYPDLDSITEEIRLLKEQNQEDSISPEAVMGARLELKDLEENINHKKEEMGSLSSSMKFLQEKRSLDDIKSEILALEQEKNDMLKKHDRLILMKNIIYSADRRFRDEHQPDVLKKAGKYLEGITEGRYTRLLSSEDGGEGLLVRTSCDSEPIAASYPLSRGTLEQIYLSLRLAVIDHLDENRERLPLFLDEAFVNWDGIRLENGIRLLKDISATRQIFLFTCHEAIAEQICRLSNTTIINLE